ncbi:Bromodomain [Macleaya cordata]|uniref:Bromodomain n=1 Tax=Macleaya cordata TaxID=56857 RepID=A0A200QTX5_MACCD|nr:Bromodomain [Macleaya cordata]
MSETEMMVMNWGTWEELLLGGAVLRHGTRAWDAVASELRSRTLYPFCFTAEVCKAKYKDLRKRYCGCNSAWFEELRKQRVTELKRELEKSDDSIGSLETKIESLKAEKVEDQNAKYDSSRTESPVSDGSTEGVGFSGKETSNSKDGLSAGSFTEETRTIWTPESQIPATVSNQETDIIIKTEERENTTNVETIGGDRISNLRKRRGKRKRKDCSSKEVNNKDEVSVGDSDVLSTADAAALMVDAQDHNSGDCDPTVEKEEDDLDLMKILNLFVEDENAAVFRCRLDSQKRAKYKKTIRCHVDFNTIRSRINNRSITSSRELYRDLLLLSNNALVFYPKNTREYISAICVRDLASKTFRQDRSLSGRDSGGAGPAGGGAVSDEPPPCNPPVKPRSIRPRIRKVAAKVVAVEETPPKRENKKDCDVEIIPAESSPEEVVVKKVAGRTGKVGGGGGGSGRKRSETPVKRRKRTRRR